MVRPLATFHSIVAVGMRQILAHGYQPRIFYSTLSERRWRFQSNVMAWKDVDCDHAADQKWLGLHKRLSARL